MICDYCKKETHMKKDYVRNIYSHVIYVDPYGQKITADPPPALLIEYCGYCSCASKKSWEETVDILIKRKNLEKLWSILALDE